MSEGNVQVGERWWGEEKFMWVAGFFVLLTATRGTEKIIALRGDSTVSYIK
jgi:hypothetical protein